MDTNNTENTQMNQSQTNTQPIAQDAPQPVTEQVAPPQPTASTSVSTPNVSNEENYAPKKSHKKIVILLVILILMILGMGAYLIFYKDVMSNQKAASAKNEIVVPTVTLTPTIAIPDNVEDVQVESPDADINALEKDAQGL